MANVSRKHTNVGREKLRTTIRAQNFQWELLHAGQVLVGFSWCEPTEAFVVQIRAHWLEAHIDVIVF